MLYVLSEDSHKADRAEAIIAMGGVISVQINQNMQDHWEETILNEIERVDCVIAVQGAGAAKSE